LLCGFFGAVAPVPQAHDPRAVLMGAVKRNASHVGEVDTKLQAEFKQFVLAKIANWPICDVLSHSEWLKECKLPNFKKEEMKREFDTIYSTSG
jgi:hypothetical protein